MGETKIFGNLTSRLGIGMGIGRGTYIGVGMG